MDTDAWRVVGVSVQGLNHARKSVPCQDAHGWRLLPGKVLAAVVSDGAGSAAMAEVGAQLTAHTALDHLAQKPAAGAWPDTEMAWREWLMALLETTRAAVFSEASQRQMPARELAATLICVLATPTWTVAAQVGDGAVVAGDAPGQWRALTRPESAEYLNETTFLVSPGALDRVQIKLERVRIAHLAMFCDGLQMLALKMPPGEPYLPFFQPLMRLLDQPTGSPAEEQLTAFLRSPRVGARTDDDLTLVLASRGPTPA